MRQRSGGRTWIRRLLHGRERGLLESLWSEGFVPVAPCLGLGADNELYNINADHMAAACAEYLGADQLIYLTDVAGVLDGEQSACRRSLRGNRAAGAMPRRFGRDGVETGSGEARHRRWRARSADCGRDADPMRC